MAALARRSALLALLVVALAVSVALPTGARAAAGSGPAPSVDEPAPTSLQAAASTDSFAFGQLSSIWIRGTVSVPGALLTLSARAGDAAWAPVASTVAAAEGEFAFADVPAPSSTTEYAVVFEGDGEHAPATVSLTVTVLPLVTLTAPATVWLAPGEAFRLSGAVAPSHPGRGIFIDRRRPDGTWLQIAEATLDADSRFALDLASEQFGQLPLRARFDADADHGAGVSTTRSVVVNRHNAHRVPYRYAHYIVTVVHEYTLYYYEHGEMLRSFRVALGRPGYRTPIGTYAIYYKRRPGGGALGSCAMFYRRAGGIAIHGTNQPGLLSRFPRPFSHGCARMYNAEALWLYYRCPVGTPVRNVR